MTFENGETQKSFTIPIADDTALEPDETLAVQLLNPDGGGTLGSPSQGILTITNDDLAGVFQFAVTTANTTEGATALADSRPLRRAALLHKVPYYTTLSGAVAAAQGIKAYLGGDLEVRALQSYFGGPA